MVEIKGLSKSYGEHLVLNDLSLRIEKGKITSFVGANGTGKSTLLSIIARFLKANRGEILLEGQRIDAIKDFDMAKKVAVLKQMNNVHIKLTIRELVSFGRFPHSKGRLTKDDNAAIDQAITYLALDEIQHKHIDEISGGQRQLAFIAMVVAQDTDYILLDEPLNNLDMKHSVQIMKTLRRLVDELNKTIILVIHDINFASCYSDNIVALKGGRVLKNGKTSDIIDPQHLRDIFDIDFDIREINDQKVCAYFR